MGACGELDADRTHRGNQGKESPPGGFHLSGSNRARGRLSCSGEAVLWTVRSLSLEECSWDRITLGRDAGKGIPVSGMGRGLEVNR